jgi:uncharacterized metal-binding protein
MQIRTLLAAAAMAFSTVSAGALFNPKCDACAALVIKANICTDILTIDGHCDPVKACPCWRKCLDDPLITADIKILIKELLLICVCASV